MACKYCHKPKAIVGRRYQVDGDTYILARLDFDSYALISLRDGNRWEDPKPMAALNLRDAKLLKENHNAYRQN